MNSNNLSLKTSAALNFTGRSLPLLAATVLFLACSSTAAAAQQTGQHQPTGAGQIVQDKFGGRIFGFDIDQNGSEGVLSEARDLANGTILAAVETFDQKTGKILKVLSKIQRHDDFITNGIVGNGVGLIEHEHEIDPLHVKRNFLTADPLGSNKFTGKWTPPLQKGDIITSISRNQGVPSVAVLAEATGKDTHTFVFSSNVAANTFGPFITIKDAHLSVQNGVLLAFDSKNNRAVLTAFKGTTLKPPVVGLLDLASGKLTQFRALGKGSPEGLAVDSATGIACITTQTDNSVQFLNLKTRTGVIEVLPRAGFGNAVAVDAAHGLFLVAQPSSGAGTISVYDEKGSLQETLDGFHFDDTIGFPIHIALNPGQRSGYIDGPDQGRTQIQAFTY